MSPLRDVSADHAAIQRISTELLAAVNAADVARVLAGWADDGVLMPPHHPPVLGRAALTRYFSDLFTRTELTFAFTSSAIEVFDGGAVERLAYTAHAVPKVGGPAVEDSGTGLHVYRRVPGGAWMLAQDIWHSDRPLTGPESRGVTLSRGS